MKFDTTKDILISGKIAEQIIGQDPALELIKKAAKQRRHVLLIGEPGTGKSMLGQALAELLPNEKLTDIVSFDNPTDENKPIIKTFPKGQARDLVFREKLRFGASAKNQYFLFFILAAISILIPWWVRKDYGDIMGAASLIGSMIFLGAFVIFLNFSRKIKSQTVPKIIIDNAEIEKTPFQDACLLPGQKVFTNPHPTEIEKTAGKLVYNSKGKPQRVIKVEKIPWKGKVYYIKPRLLFPFTATQNHPFLVLERPKTKQFKERDFNRISNKLYNYIKWKRANQLKEGDMLIYPELNHPQEKIKISFENKPNRKKQINDIKLDGELAEILGWFLAEGYTRNYTRNNHRRGEVGFVLGKKEEQEAKHLASLLEKKFKLKVSFDYHNKEAIGLVVYSKTLSEWFEKEFGKGAKNKKIPKIIFESPKEIKKEFLNSYIKGDGYEKGDAFSVATVSKNIAEDIVFLFSSLGIFPACNYKKMANSKIKGRVIKGSILYEFNITGKQLNKLGKKGYFQHYFTKDNLHFIPIRKISVKDYEGDIINMETEDGTYLMPCITHNTGAHAGALLGDVLHDPLQSGGLGTPAYQRLVPGMIHRANGGVLFIDEIANLRPESQQELLTVIQEKKYPITGQSERSSGAMVRSEPVPCDFVLVAAGNVETVRKMHPALRSRIRGYGYEIYMNNNIEDTPENRDKIARFVAQEITKDGKIPHFSYSAVQEIIQEARKRAGTAGKLTLKLRELGGLIRAAGDLALEQGFQIVEPKHVLQAKKLARTLEHQIADKYIENKKNYDIIITEGEKIGRVNGLAVLGSDSSYSGIVLPIESEVAMGGKKAEIIATGQLGKIAKEAIKNVSAIILKYFGEDVKEKYDIFVQFLQTSQTGVEGDSASIAVAVAIISALKKVPIYQDLALTGSLSVRGDVLAVGGISAKVEAAIDTGIKRIIIPRVNEKDVVISKERLSKIKIIPVTNIVEVLEQALDWKNSPASQAFKKIKSLQEKENKKYKKPETS